MFFGKLLWKSQFAFSRNETFRIFLNTIESQKSFISCYSHFTTQEIRKLVDSSIQQVLEKLVENFIFSALLSKDFEQIAAANLLTQVLAQFPDVNKQAENCKKKRQRLLSNYVSKVEK